MPTEIVSRTSANQCNEVGRHGADFRVIVGRAIFGKLSKRLASLYPRHPACRAEVDPTEPHPTLQTSALVKQYAHCPAEPDLPFSGTAFHSPISSPRDSPDRSP